MKTSSGEVGDPISPILRGNDCQGVIRVLQNRAKDGGDEPGVG